MIKLQVLITIGNANCHKGFKLHDTNNVLPEAYLWEQINDYAFPVSNNVNEEICIMRQTPLFEVKLQSMVIKKKTYNKMVR